MKCMHCQGNMKQEAAPFYIKRNGYHLTLEAVPAWVCSQCGEAYYEESEVEAIQNVINSMDAQTKTLSSQPQDFV